MLSIAECRKHLEGLKMSDKEVESLRSALYAMVSAILDNYVENSAKIDICDKKQSFIAESQVSGRVLKDTGLIAKSIVAENSQK